MKLGVGQTKYGVHDVIHQTKAVFAPENGLRRVH